MMQRTPARVAYYESVIFLFRMLCLGLLKLRVSGREHLDVSGGALILSNHQSMLDPVLAGCAIPRRVSFLARQTLFRNRIFGWLCDYGGAIAIDRDGSGLGGLKETLKRLKSGEMILVFPEGTRSRDGNLTPLKGGFTVLAKRGNVPLIPMAIDGAHVSWPRGQKLPGVATIQVVIGEPVPAEVVKTWSDEQLLAEMSQRIQVCLTEARAQRLIRVQQTAPSNVSVTCDSG